jgi:hypothetical protein
MYTATFFFFWDRSSIYSRSQPIFIVEENPMQDHLPENVTTTCPKVTAHSMLFYELIEQHYKTPANYSR